MVKEAPSNVLEKLGRRHPIALVTLNLGLLVLITEFLLTSTEAPVVLYQAF